MKIAEFLNKKGIQSEVASLKRYQIVHVSFLNKNKMSDEVSFDVAHIATKAGNQELITLFNNFCKENNEVNPDILSITVVASANSWEALKEINM